MCVCVCVDRNFIILFDLDRKTLTYQSCRIHRVYILKTKFIHFNTRR